MAHLRCDYVNQSRTTRMRGFAQKLSGLFVMLCLAITSVQAQPSLLTAGEAIFLRGTEAGRPACAACHMPNAAGQPEVGIPRLAGLSTAYLLDQLGYFASGQRHWD